MVELICFVFPALFSVFALERLLTKTLKLRNFLMVFVTNTILINLLGLFIMFCLSGAKVMPFSVAAGININFTLVYLTITFVLSVILVILERFYFYRLRIGIHDKAPEKENENK